MAAAVPGHPLGFVSCSASSTQLVEYNSVPKGAALMFGLPGVTGAVAHVRAPSRLVVALVWIAVTV